MSLGKPDLYIAGQLMQTAKGDPQPALAGLQLSWGNDSRLEMDPASKLSGQLLIKGTLPAWLEVGAPVGLVDPVSGRCLFAGNLAPLKAAPEDSVGGAMRVSFTASSPLAELQKHRVVDVNWDPNTPAGTRFNTLTGALPRGWALTGSTGGSVNQTKQQYKAIEWLTLATRFCRSYLYRYHDTSFYVPGAGLSKRLTFSPERGKALTGALPAAGPAGIWTGSAAPAGASGMAVLPTSAVRQGIDWEKSPEDMITDVQLASFAATETDVDRDSTRFEVWMSQTPVFVDNTSLQDRYGFRQVQFDTSIAFADMNAAGAQFRAIVNYWLDTANKWRPTDLQLPDSRRLDTAPLLNLLAVDTRGTAAIAVPAATTLAPGLIQSFVMAGSATWTGKKWTLDLTLGRTL